jgi:hypothetical protein
LGTQRNRIFPSWTHAIAQFDIAQIIGYIKPISIWANGDERLQTIDINTPDEFITVERIREHPHRLARKSEGCNSVAQRIGILHTSAVNTFLRGSTGLHCSFGPGLVAV